jgi:hypothetical protein
MHHYRFICARWRRIGDTAAAQGLPLRRAARETESRSCAALADPAAARMPTQDSRSLALPGLGGLKSSKSSGSRLTVARIETQAWGWRARLAAGEGQQQAHLSRYSYSDLSI